MPNQEAANTWWSPAAWAAVAFIAGGASILFGTGRWLARIDRHALLRAEERLQNKDALVIGAGFLLAVHFGFCVTGAAVGGLYIKAVWAIFLALLWALATTAVGGIFGFLFGLPRRPSEDTAAKDAKPTSPMLLKTGLDDIIDWLVKGITTVALVNGKDVLKHLPGVADRLAKGLGTLDAGAGGTASASAVALSLIVFFACTGFLGAYLVTRTFLTGALTRADRSTLGALSSAGLTFSEALLFTHSQRSLSSGGRKLNAEGLRIAKKLAELPLTELHTPQELAMWAKAKSVLGQPDEAFEAYEKALGLCGGDPALLLDYAVALDEAGRLKSEVLQRMQEAYEHLCAATPAEVRKNIYKSLTYAALYLPEPEGFRRALALAEEYRQRKDALPSGGLLVNEVCGWAQKFRWEGQRTGLLIIEPGQTIQLPPRTKWTAEMNEAFTRALAATIQALEFAPAWGERFRLLLQHDHPDKKAHPELADESDLEVFESLEEFRSLLGLTPQSPTNSTS